MMKGSTFISFFSNGLRLSGVLHLPAVLPAPFVIGCHGLFADKQSPKQIALAERCAEAGLAYFRFDHRGCGDSEGDFATDTSLAARCRDLTDAVKAMHGRNETTRLSGLFGSSMGGTVVLASARNLSPDRLVTAAAPLTSAPVINAIRHSGDVTAERMPDRFFSRDLKFDITTAVTGLNHILIFHGDADSIVPYENAEKIYDACREPKKLIRQKNGDHRISDPDHQRKFIKNAAAWFIDGRQP